VRMEVLEAGEALLGFAVGVDEEYQHRFYLIL